MSTHIRETAKLRAKERALRPLLKAVNYDNTLPIRMAYFRKAHPRASICCKRPRP